MTVPCVDYTENRRKCQPCYRDSFPCYNTDFRSAGVMLADARRLPFKPCKGQLKFFTPHI